MIGTAVRRDPDPIEDWQVVGWDEDIDASGDADLLAGESVVERKPVVALSSAQHPHRVGQDKA